MSDFFSKDSRTAGWVKVVFLFALTICAVGTFLGGAYFFCGQDIWKPGICTVLLALLVFLTIPRCSEELEKWGRFQSNAAIWATFVLGLVSSGVMIFASLFALQGQIRWNDLSLKYGEALNEGMEIIEEYKTIREDYFVLLEEKMNSGLSRSQLGQTPGYMSECPISLTSRGLSRGVVNARLASLKEEVRIAEGSAISGSSQLAQGLRSSLTRVGVVQRCEVPNRILDFQETVARLDVVMKDHISNVDCDGAPISASHGPWLSRMRTFKTTSVAAIAPMELLKGIDVLSGLGALLLLLLTLSPVLLVRTPQTSKSKSGSSETEI